MNSDPFRQIMHQDRGSKKPFGYPSIDPVYVLQHLGGDADVHGTGARVGGSRIQTKNKLPEKMILESIEG